jgi:hypothetical protein
MKIHCRVLLVSKNNLESLVFLFLDFQGWNPNFKWLKIFKLGFRFSLNETIVEIAILELGKYFLFNFMGFPKFTILNWFLGKIILGIKS